MSGMKADQKLMILCYKKAEENMCQEPAFGSKPQCSNRDKSLCTHVSAVTAELHQCLMNLLFNLLPKRQQYTSFEFMV